jgi:hypothetical protein
MRTPTEVIIRKLVLLGIPLLSTAACDAFQSSCGDDPKPVTTYVEIDRPDDAADAGFGAVSATAYDRCVQTGDCRPVCEERYRYSATVISCTRVATDAGDPASERIGLHATVQHTCEGRRPEGHEDPAQVVARCDLGAWLARAAHLETASVPAFDRLARELAAHGAPASLVARARAAKRDERRHTRVMTALARRLGAQVPDSPPFKIQQVRTLEEIAVENAVEGCVRETLGAVVARHQATWAADPHIRAAMRMIARDEARHADLAWDVDAWISGQSPASVAGVRRARAQMAAQILHEIDAPLPQALIRAAGFPAPPVARQIAETMTRELWAA